MATKKSAGRKPAAKRSRKEPARLRVVARPTMQGSQFRRFNIMRGSKVVAYVSTRTVGGVVTERGVEFERSAINFCPDEVCAGYDPETGNDIKITEALVRRGRKMLALVKL